MAETDFKYDVFISYSHKDEEWVVNTLLPALENADLKVCIDYRDFDAGKPSIVNMEDAVDESRHTVLVLTPNWMGSEWTDFEAVLTQTDDPVGRRQKMIPMMLEKCTPPKRVRSLTYVDFMRSDRLDNAWAQLFKALGKPEAFKPSNLQPETREAWHLAHPYPMPPNFTGRAIELKTLDDWLADNTNRLFILRALGGFGKSALAWQWINTHVNPTEWTKLVWWSFYEGDASFEHFIEETLKFLKFEVPQSKRDQVDVLLHAMQSQKVLFILDGFERLLRAYSNMNAAHQGDFDKKIEDTDRDCVNLDSEYFLKGICSMPNMKSKALMTTRMTPRALEKFGQYIQGCHEEELNAMNKDDAIAFFRAQGVHKGTNHEIEDTCRLYGFHPLSLRLLAGHIMTDFKNPGDIVVAQKLKVSGDVAQHQNHILEVSYNGLSARQQKLLSTIACFRSSTKFETLEEVVENKDSLDDDLHDLMERGLLQYDRKNNVFDLHPIVRRFAYDRLTAPQRKDAHVVLVVYFEAIPQPQKIEKLEDLTPVIELYHHMVRAGNLDDARVLYRDRLDPLYYQFSAYQLIVELLQALFIDGEDKPPRLKDESAQAWTLNELANSYSLTGRPHRAVQLWEIANDIYENKTKNKQHLAVGLGAVTSVALVPIGALGAAERNLRRKIDLCREIKDEFDEATGHQQLGRVLSYCGMWQDAEQELGIALKLFDDPRNGVRAHWMGLTYSYFATRLILMTRSEQNQSLKREISNNVNEAIKFMEEFSKTNYPIMREHVRNFWLLGTSYRINNDLTLAEENLSKALNLCRQINLVEMEANILLDIAQLRYEQGDFKDAQEKASEALVITERSGYVLQGADVNLFLAQFALEQEKDKAKAKQYAEEAKKLATCDGPPHYYKVAYEEVERFLEKLK